MFTFTFFKKPVVLGVATVFSFSVTPPAMAEKPKAPYLPKDKAQITQVKGHPFMVVDFTKSSAACLDK